MMRMLSWIVLISAKVVTEPRCAQLVVCTFHFNTGIHMHVVDMKLPDVSDN